MMWTLSCVCVEGEGGGEGVTVENVCESVRGVGGRQREEKEGKGREKDKRSDEDN